VPKELKQKVMDDINTVKFIIEVTSLFSSNYAETIEGMFRHKSKTTTILINKYSFEPVKIGYF
jgi:hypothetical protein